MTDTPSNLVADALIPSLWRLPLPANTLPPYDHTNSYVLLDEDNQAVVVDVGSVEAAEMLIGWLAAHQYNLESVLLTHTHSDHIAGLGWLLEHTPVPVHVHPLEQDRLHEHLRDYTDIHDLADGDVFIHGEFHIYSVHTPGHSPGHFSFVVHDRNRPTDANVMLAGDMVTGDGAIWVGTSEGDVTAYLQSLARLSAMSVNCLAPSHGAVSQQPHVLLDKARNHKEAREQQVLALLEQPTSLADLTNQLYTDVPDALRDFAERSLAAHLAKLLSEGRIHKRQGAQRKVRYQRHKLNT